MRYAQTGMKKLEEFLAKGEEGMKRKRTTLKRLFAAALSGTLALSAVPMDWATVAKAAGDDNYEEIVVPNGDFESAQTAWKFEGDIDESHSEVENQQYYWRIFQNPSDKQNTTSMYEVYSDSAANEKSYRISQTIENLKPGTYKASVQAAGGNDPGTYSAVLTAGDASVELTPTEWANWITYDTDTFSVTGDSVTISLDTTVAENYLNIDNIKLYRVDDAIKGVESIQPSAVKVRQNGTFTAPNQVTVSYTDGSTGKADVVWNEEELEAVDTAQVQEYTVTGKATVGEEQYDAVLTVTVIEASESVQEIAKDAEGSVDFNENWQFYLATRTPQENGSFADGGLKDAGDYTTEEIIDPAFNDAGWRTVDVPHDFSIEGEKVSNSNNAQAYLQGGLAYYRKTFTVPESMQGNKTITIDFEGVYQNSIVYLNGKEIGNYPNGYTGFAYDITNEIQYGKENVLVVKVQNMSPSGRWYTGSGIVRPVHLTVDNLAHFNRNGITLSTPDLEETYTSYQAAELNVSAKGYSDSVNADVYLKTTVFDAEGEIVAEETGDNMAINPSTAFNLTDDIRIENVNLWYPWNLGTPYLYTVRTELYLQKSGESEYTLVDSVDTEYGFRWFEVQETTEDPNSGGLYVNGQYTKVQGVDLHHDSGALGAASYTDAYERQFTKLKDMGVNAYRTSHCPPSKQVIEVCRRMGILVVEEAFDGWGTTKASYDFGKFFMKEVPSDWAGLKANGMIGVPSPGIDYDGVKYTWSDWVIQEMINRDKNEPSIFAWSIGNEVRGVGGRPSWYDVNQYDPLGAKPGNINEYTEAVRLLADVDAVDSSRLVVMGGDQERSVPDAKGTWGLVNQVLDGYGLNYNTAKSVDGLIDRFTIGDGGLFENGNHAFFFESESSSQTSSRGVYLDADLTNTGINETPGRRGGSNYDNDFASWTMSNEYGLKKDRDRKSFIGQFIWTGFDYLGEPTPYNVYPVGVASFGTIDTAGFPKDSFYLYQSQWVKDPMVHLLPTNWDEWREGETVDVWVNANVQTAELFLNGESLGKKSFDKKTTAYGKEYLETSERTADDKTWGDNTNPGGYTSEGAVVDEGSTNYGKLHLSWKVPYEEGTLEVRAYDEHGDVVATDSVTTSKTPYTIKAEADKTVLAADGTSLSYVECTIVDEDGNMVPDADNLVKFQVEGAAKIVGVDNGQQESTELYKWGNVDENTYSQRSAYHGKVLVILQSEREAGDVTLTIGSENLKTTQVALKVTEDGTGEAPEQPVTEETLISVDPVEISVPEQQKVTLPGTVTVHYDGGAAGEYTLVKNVTWDTPVSGVGTVEGTVDGLAEKAQAVISADPEMITDVNIAANQALGSGSNIFSFDGLDADSPVHDGALATASFTGSTQNYPNNMLDGDEATTWTNAYSRGASVLLPANSASRKSEYVEFFWDEAKVLNQVSLSFVTNSSKVALPSVLEVQYWNGDAWVAVEDQVTTLASESNAPTVMRFETVYTDRIRVYMENATPYSSRGNIEISEVKVEMSTKVPPVHMNPDTDQDEVVTGQAFTVDIPLVNLPLENELRSLTFKLNYDSAVFEVPGIALAEGVPGELSVEEDTDGLIVSYTNEEGISSDAESFLTMTLQVKETASAGETDITMTDMAAVDTQGQELEVTASSLQIKVGVEGETYVSDLTWLSASSGWESVEIDKNCNGANSSAIALKVNGERKEFEKGLGVCADSEVRYDISSFQEGKGEGDFLRLQAWIGIDYFKVEGNQNGDGVYFIVYGDNQELYRSELLDTNSEAVFIDVDVTGVEELRLYVDKNGTNSHDNADWADLKLVEQSIAMSQESVSVEPQKEQKITATVRPASLAEEAVWESANPEIAEVTGSIEDGIPVGTIRGIAPGETTISITAGGNTVFVPVTVVKVFPESITLDVAEYTLGIGESYTLGTTLAPSNTTEKTIEWLSSNSQVASVDENGQVTGVAPGNAAITAVTENGKTASCVITVSKEPVQEIPVTSMELSETQKELVVGQSFVLGAVVKPGDTTQSKEVRFSSDNRNVAMVDAEGNVMAISQGTAVITAVSVANPDISATCQITVKAATPEVIPVTAIQLSDKRKELEVGDTFKLEAQVSPEDTTQSKDVMYSSDQDQVATVDAGGNITAVGAGVAVITAESAANEQVYAECVVVVKNPSVPQTPVTAIQLLSTQVTIKEGSSYQIFANVVPENTTQSKALVYLSGNDQIATVDADGRVTAKAAGTVTITVVSLANTRQKSLH